jgi:hypothetical protein
MITQGLAAARVANAATLLLIASFTDRRIARYLGP